jgi:predicted adenine nucleotide alpha hydrolase (AANH) superfamily ATPase
MYTGKVIPVEPITGMEGWGEKRRMMEEVNSNMIYLIYCKNFCGCHNVLHPTNNKRNDYSKRKKSLNVDGKWIAK